MSVALVLGSAGPSPASQGDDTARIIKMLGSTCSTQDRVHLEAPAPWRPGRILVVSSGGSFDAAVAQARDLAQVTSSPAPGALASGAPSALGAPTPLPGGLLGSGASPSPSATPSLIPLVPPNSVPGQLVQPTPYSGATALPTPPPLPTPTPTSKAAKEPIPLVQPTSVPSFPPGAGSPSPSAAPTTIPTASATAPSGPTPTPVPTLGPNQFAVLADAVSGSTKDGVPADATGHVTIFYADGLLYGDKAHYDGDRYIDITGHAYVKNRAGDTILFADQVRFDRYTQKAYLVNGNGATTEGVDQGLLHFRGKQLQTARTGVIHGDNAYLTTCENPRGGYHIEGKTIDETPNDKIVVRHATLFLGALAIFYLPLLLIPLHQPGDRGKREQGFLPEFGYSQAEGFFVKTRIGFQPSVYYYGSYKVEAYTKLGLKLGYQAFFRKQNGKRQSDVSFERFANKQSKGVSYNATVNDTENFSQTLRSQLGLTYRGDYGPTVNLPASFALNGSVSHATARASQNYTFQRYTAGSQQSSLNLGFVDQRQLLKGLTQGINIGYSKNASGYSGVTSENSSLHLNSLTHLTTPGVDYDLTFDRTNAATPSGIEKLPELSLRPHQLFPKLRILPINAQFTLGQYTEPQKPLSTQRAKAVTNFGPILLKVFKTSDFSASVNVEQDAYGTGDLKAQIQQQMSLTTQVTKHIVNSLQYNEQNSNGPQFEPFKTLDIIGGASHGATDSLRFFNGDIYNLVLSTGTNFNRQAQPITYQLSSRPSYRSSLIVGGSYVPGAGNGFSSTNVQAATPFGRGTYVQFTTNVDWKNKGRLTNKNIYYSKIIGDCYEIQLSYNQDLKTLNLTLNLLAFPTRSVNFGLQRSAGSIIPQSLTF